ncbi:metallophosphoesterase family protein [Bradyrhizobium sp.]|uniref:metallophosphoesterase family protein n=1 Tax=Bradyrhizobium sp. TaxID=376 RepID=UPI0007C98EEC|nr:metallophosphoesterase family protein [Bradyrhizobium sp.]
MSLTYAIPDLHGRLDLLERALSRILEHAGHQTARVITLGDYVDRGPNSREVIEFLMRWSYPNLQLTALKGNHEAMMWEACNNLVEATWWIENGGTETLASYGEFIPGMPLRTVVPPHHLAWIAELPTLFADSKRVFVHAGLDPRLPLSQQSERTLLWKRYPKRGASGHGSRHVVHGHDADERAPLVSSGKTNLDAMAWKTGRLVVGVFADELPGGAVEFLEVLESQL